MCFSLLTLAKMVLESYFVILNSGSFPQQSEVSSMVMKGSVFVG